MPASVALRYVAIIAGTVLWDVGAVLQKKAMQRLPPTRPRVLDLAGSPLWVGGMLITGVGWGLYVLGLEQVPVSAARTVTGGSYVVLALFSMVFLRAPLRGAEWLAVAAVSAGIVMLGLSETARSGLAAAPSVSRLVPGVASIVVVCLLLLLAESRLHGRFLVKPLFVFAAFSGLCSSVGDLLVKVLLAGGGGLVLAAVTTVGLVAFYLAGFYMLSRAYQAGTMVGAIVVSDFFARVGALFPGVIVLSEPLAGPGGGGILRAVGFALVLGGSLLLGRFGAVAPGNGST
jgi:multidrug transporter EmrE-like cation transporter